MATTSLLPDPPPESNSGVLQLFLGDRHHPTGALVFTSGLVILACALVLERFIGARLTRFDALLILFALVPQAILFQVPAWRRFARQHMSEAAASIVTIDVILLSVLSARHTLPTDEWPWVLEYTVLLIVFSYLLSGQVLRHAVLTGLSALVIATGALVLLGDPSPPALRRAMFTLAATNAIGAVGRVGIDRAWMARTKQLLAVSDAARRDPLTGVANRRGMAVQLSQTMRVASRDGWELALAMFDLDGFKAINDQFGHAAGDQALVRIAEALTATARRPLDVVGRHGGDEFLVLWTRVEDDQPQALAQDLLRRIEAVTFGDVPLSASVGCVSFRAAPDLDLDELISRADDAAREAKQAGGAQVRWYRLEQAGLVTRS